MVDISPAIGKLSPEFEAYIGAMKEIDAAKVHSRKEADEILERTEPVRSRHHSVSLCLAPYVGGAQ